ncbi:hypothetical protein DPEC_G00361910 [Dallia pectoralis]|nr:hypothetical protein DPEC_G00361910 [Dallia pectoralis]
MPRRGCSSSSNPLPAGRLREARSASTCDIVAVIEKNYDQSLVSGERVQLPRKPLPPCAWPETVWKADDSQQAAASLHLDIDVAQAQINTCVPSVRPHEGNCSSCRPSDTPRNRSIPFVQPRLDPVIRGSLLTSVITMQYDYDSFLTVADLCVQPVPAAPATLLSQSRYML